MKKATPLFILLIFLAQNLFAVNYTSNFINQSQVRTIIKIKGEGIYNLVVTANFLKRPRDYKVYLSDEYGELINRLDVEWREIATTKILNVKSIEVEKIIDLKNAIQSDVNLLIEKLKKAYMPDKDIDIIFSISDFYLINPNAVEYNMSSNFNKAR